MWTRTRASRRYTTSLRKRTQKRKTSRCGTGRCAGRFLFVIGARILGAYRSSRMGGTAGPARVGDGPDGQACVGLRLAVEHLDQQRDTKCHRPGRQHAQPRKEPQVAQQDHQADADERHPRSTASRPRPACRSPSSLRVAPGSDAVWCRTCAWPRGRGAAPRLTEYLAGIRNGDPEDQVQRNREARRRRSASIKRMRNRSGFTAKVEAQPATYAGDNAIVLAAV